MARQKDVLTTGEVARICSVAPRTVSKWFDSGQLHGYRIPGSKDRRIPVASLVRFMKQHHIPLDGLASGRTRVLLVDPDTEILDVLHKALTEGTSYEVRTAASGFTAGLECEKFRPHAIVLDIHLPDADSREILRIVRDNPDLQLAKVIAASSRLTEGQAQQLLNGGGFDGFLRKPYNVRQAIQAIEEAVAIVY
jgi:excisionase family DNA binding protein